MSGAPKEELMAAIKASLQAMYPARVVLRGLQDPAVLGDEQLRLGVYSIIAEMTAGWPGYVGREAEQGNVKFAIVYYGLEPEDPAANLTERVETHENLREQELLDWCNAPRPEPLDCLYPKRAGNSRGLDAPVAWLVMEMEGDYV